jgi:adenine-specific DNA glycosylase
VELGKRHCRREPQCDGCPLSEAAYHPPFVGHGTSKRRAIAAAKR